MIDLTPLDVRKKRGDFSTKLRRGYDPEEVDGFLELVAERFEELVKENLTLSERVERFGGQLKALEGRESAVQEALVSAQKLREEVSDQTQREVASLKDQSRREAVILKAEAETEISRRLGEAEGLMRERQWALEELEKSRKKFLKGFRSLLERELEALEVEESRRPLEETPLDLNLRGWTPAGEEDEDPEEATQEEEEDEATGGFETQRLEVPVTSGLAHEPEPAEPEDEGATELEASGFEAEAEPEAELEAELEADPEADPVTDPAPDPETVAGEFVDLVADDIEGAAFVDEPSDELDSVEFTDDVSEGPTSEPELEEEFLEAQGQEPDPESAMEEGESASTPQEPKWLFSLLKREEGEGSEGEAEDGNSKGEA